MTKKRTRQSMQRQAKKLEIPCIEAAILNALGRDLALAEAFITIGNAELDRRPASINQQLQKSTNRVPGGQPRDCGIAKERIFSHPPPFYRQKSLNGAALNCV
jgi:hypothetical protein